MALHFPKTEMHGDTSRWGHRAEAKHDADRRRRRVDAEAVEEQLGDAEWFESWTEAQIAWLRELAEDRKTKP